MELMKLWKHSLITAIAFFGITATVFYTSCEKDGCLDLKCKNGGSCADGYCRCPTGFEGTECETKSATKFLGKFYGNYTCVGQSPLTDTVEIWMYAEPNQVRIVQHSNITDSLVGTVTNEHLEIPQVSMGDYRRNTSADIINNKITIYIEEIFNVNTGAKKTCNFIGFK